MSTIDRATIRERLKNTTADEFVRAHTRKVLDEMAETLGADITEAKTKEDVYVAIVAKADLPDPALRGNSAIDEPVAFVWEQCHLNVAVPLAKGETPMRRKDVIALCVEQGVAFYTARTQYQSWFKATNKGQTGLDALPADELPEALRPKTEEATAG